MNTVIKKRATATKGQNVLIWLISFDLNSGYKNTLKSARYEIIPTLCILSMTGVVYPLHSYLHHKHFLKRDGLRWTWCHAETCRYCSFHSALTTSVQRSPLHSIINAIYQTSKNFQSLSFPVLHVNTLNSLQQTRHVHLTR